MSIASDIRAYADSAVHQSKATLSSAQASLNDIAGKANDAVSDLRASAERAINIDAIRAAVEPYLAQVKGYRATVTDRADVLIGDLKGDPRVAKVVDTANTVSGVVAETVQERVVKPVQTLTGRGGKHPAGSAPKASTTAPKAAPRPAARKAATTKPATPASKPAARKTTTKRTAPKA
ncbi:MAG TPA: hypothetical protein VFH38_12165 [Jatrophihabitans sp.]|nr:hypothetical protein [Jatrophihabitans sp.]